MSGLFKQGSCEQEVFEGMQAAEAAALIKEDTRNDCLVFEAMQALNAAAEAFEKAGRKSRAKEVTDLMICLTDDNKTSDANISKRAENHSLEEAKRVLGFFGFDDNDLGGLDL